MKKTEFYKFLSRKGYVLSRDSSIPTILASEADYEKVIKDISCLKAEADYHESLAVKLSTELPDSSLSDYIDDEPACDDKESRADLSVPEESPVVNESNKDCISSNEFSSESDGLSSPVSANLNIGQMAH